MLVWEDPLEKGMATHSSIFAWEFPWTEEPGGLQSMESQRVGRIFGTNLITLKMYKEKDKHFSYLFCINMFHNNWIVDKSSLQKNSSSLQMPMEC